MWVQEGSALRSLGLSFQGKKHLRKTSGFLPLWAEYWALISLIWRPWYPDLGPWLLESVLGSAGNVPWPPGRRYYWAIPCQLIPQIQARLPGCLLDPVTTSNTRVQSLPFPSNLRKPSMEDHDYHGISCRPMLIHVKKRGLEDVNVTEHLAKVLNFFKELMILARHYRLEVSRGSSDLSSHVKPRSNDHQSRQRIYGDIQRPQFIAIGIW